MSNFPTCNAVISTSLTELPDYVKLVNCAGCYQELLGDSMKEWWEILLPGQQRVILNLLQLGRFESPFIEGRLRQRPYCRKCLELKRLE